MSKTTVLSHPIAQHVMVALRKKKGRTNENFRRDMHRIGLMLAVEATKDLKTKSVKVETPLGIATGSRLRSRQALVSITRAGNGLLDAFLQFLPEAYVWHVSVSRNEETFKPDFHGSKIPERVPRNLDVSYVLDPMLATAGTACLTIQLLKDAGAKKIVYVGVLGANEGVARLSAEHPDVEIFLVAIDEKLTQNKFIDPGLGDAGDLQYPTV